MPPESAGVGASAQTLAVNDDGSPVVSGWFRAPEGEIRVEGLARFQFSASAELVSAYPDPGADPGEVTHSFYATATPLIAWAADGIEALHASAVAGPAGIVALCGPSERGKSTLAHALAGRGHERFAEDALAFTAAGDAVTAFALPYTVNLREPSSEHFAGVGQDEPGHVNLAATAEAPLAAVLMLEPVDEVAGTPRLELLPAAEALLALLPNAHRFTEQPVERERAMMEAYLALVDRVPVHRLTYTRLFQHLSRTLDSIEFTFLR